MRHDLNNSAIPPMYIRMEVPDPSSFFVESILLILDADASTRLKIPMRFLRRGIFRTTEAAAVGTARTSSGLVAAAQMPQ